MDSVTAYLILSLMGFTTNVDSAKIFYWKEWKPASKIPKQAVVGGKGRYVGRVNTFNGQLTAMIGTKRNVAVAINEKRIIYTKQIEILCSTNPEKLYWEPVDFENLPKGILKDAVISGFQKDIRSRLYIGRVRQPNLYKVGKVIGPKRNGTGLWIWQYEKLLHFTKFELLMMKKDER